MSITPFKIVILARLFICEVPWFNKRLTIKYGTFRDKTLPGSQEEYRVKISGLNQDKIAAEMVAAMYDASLDRLYGSRLET